MIEYAANLPAIPIPFNRLLKIVALVDDSNPQVRELLDRIAAENFEIEINDRYDRDVSEDAAVGAYIAAVDGERREPARALGRAVRGLGFGTPLWALADASRISDVSVLGMMGEVTGFIYLGQQTPAFYAKQVVASIVSYGTSLLPPFFGRLMAYDAEAKVSFACPGHQGGEFYRRSPAGQLFGKHFGEQIFRNDLCNADVELGDLLIHVGAAVEAQRHAARVFGADSTYFVLNGTSTANKVVAQATLRRGDLVLFDRNNHKSLHQGALVMAGAIPIFLPTARNAFGMIGAVDWEAWDEQYLREQIRNHPLVEDPERHKRERPFRLACIQLATYDGTIYNVRKVMEKIGHLCDYVLWDEAWIGYNAFHPVFADHSPMRLPVLGPDSAGLFSTQSVHKQGAGFSQASQIHKRDAHIRGQRRFIEHKRFNEAFLLYCSTSPFYPLFASLDVNAKVHEGKAGEMLWDRCIELGIEARKKLREFGRHAAQTGRTAEEQWFFDPFVPDVVTIRGSQLTEDAEVRWEDLPTEVIKREQQCWMFDSQATWHGYSGYADGYAMVDPNKLMLLTPGIDRKTGEYLDFGVPATVLANFLREQRIVPEKCDLNSILFLMTPAEDESKINTLIAKLVKFKDLWDRDAGLGEVLPTLYAQNSTRYAGYSLRQVCKEMHDFYRDANVKELQKQSFRASSFPQLAMLPQDAYAALVANEVDYVPLDESIDGRIAATLALIYPPGIGVIVPGERWDERARPMLEYFSTFEESFNRFPGFNYEVQGVYQEQVDGRIEFYTYVVRE